MGYCYVMDLEVDVGLLDQQRKSLAKIIGQIDQPKPFFADSEQVEDLKSILELLDEIDADVKKEV